MTRLLTKIPAHRTGLTAGAVVCGHGGSRSRPPSASRSRVTRPAP